MNALHAGSGMVALAWLLTGCAVFQPTDAYRPVAGTEVPAPAPFQAAPPATNVFTAPLTLQHCLALAARNNPALAAAGQDAEVARARLRAANAGRLPTLSAEGGYFRNLDNQRLIQSRSPTDPVSFSPDLFQGGFVVRLPVFTGGRLRNEVKAAAMSGAAGEQQVRRVSEELAFEVSRVFYGILAWEKSIGALAFSKDVLTEHRRRVQNLLEAQKAAPVDLLRTDVRLANVEQDLVSARNTLAVQRRVLVTDLGWSATEPLPDIAGTLAFAPVTTEVGAALSRAMTQRPDYLAAHRLLEAQARRVDIARAGRAPSIGVVGSYGGRANARDEVDVGSAGMVVSIPLFEGGLTAAKVKEERARLAAAQERLRQLELQIRLDVTTSISDLDSSAERVRATETAISQARESLRIEREKYDLGKGSITDVLDAQSALLQAETNYYRALADHAIARARLQLAEGGSL